MSLLNQNDLTKNEITLIYEANCLYNDRSVARNKLLNLLCSIRNPRESDKVKMINEILNYTKTHQAFQLKMKDMKNFSLNTKKAYEHVMKKLLEQDSDKRYEILADEYKHIFKN